MIPPQLLLHLTWHSATDMTPILGEERGRVNQVRGSLLRRSYGRSAFFSRRSRWHGRVGSCLTSVRLLSHRSIPLLVLLFLRMCAFAHTFFYPSIEDTYLAHISFRLSRLCLPRDLNLRFSCRARGIQLYAFDVTETSRFNAGFN
jgi:hypothetical protein